MTKDIILKLLDLVLNLYGQKRTSPAEETVRWLKTRAALTKGDRGILWLIEDNQLISADRLKEIVTDTTHLSCRLKVLMAYGFIEQDSSDRWTLTEVYSEHAPPPSAKTTLV